MDTMEDAQYLKTLGNRINKIRTEKKVPLAEFARDVGVNRNTIYRIESGEHACSIIILRAIARELEIKLSDLIDNG